MASKTRSTESANGTMRGTAFSFSSTRSVAGRESFFMHPHTPAPAPVHPVCGFFSFGVCVDGSVHARGIS